MNPVLIDLNGKIYLIIHCRKNIKYLVHSNFFLEYLSLKTFNLRDEMCAIYFVKLLLKIMFIFA